MADDGLQTWTITVAASDTAVLQAGSYQLVGRVTLGSIVTDVFSQRVEVTPNLATAVAGSLLSHEERSIPLLEAAIQRRVTVDLKAYQIHTRAATREELKEMQSLLHTYRWRVYYLRTNGQTPVHAFRFTGRA